MKKFLTTTLSTIVLVASMFGGSAAAAGNASLTMSPASGSYTVGSNITINISENSSDSVNTVEADVNYDASKLQFVSAACSGSFEIAAQANANGITCGTTTPKTAPTVVGSMTFRAVTAGSASINFSASSHIYTSAQADVWNGSTAGANFTIAAPAPVTPTTPTTPTTPGTGTPAPTTPAPTTPVTPTTPTTPGTGTVAGDSTKLYTVTITVTDSRGDEVKDAQVTLNGKTATSNRSGKVTFTAVKAGSYDIKATANNLSVSSKVTVNAKNKTTQNFLVELPKAKKNRFAFILGTSATILIIGGGLLLSRKRRSTVAAPAAIVVAPTQAKKAATKRAKKSTVSLATAK